MAARKAGIFAASGVTYGVSVYLTYMYFSAPKNNENENLQTSTTTSVKLGSASSCSCQHHRNNNHINNNNTQPLSYVSNPFRTQTFQKIASTYDDEIDRDEFFMGIKLLRRALFYFHAKGDILEVACGTGRNLDYYPSEYTSSTHPAVTSDIKEDKQHNSISKIILCDSSDQMLEQARQKHLASLPSSKKKRSMNSPYNNIKFQKADACDLPQDKFKDNSFDTVVDTFGLCSVEDPVKALKEMKRVTRDGTGRILLLEHGTTHSFQTLADYLDKYAERHAKKWGCVWNRDILKIIEEAGLEIETLHTFHFGTTYYIVCKPKE